jgi:hypothetical protein
VNPKFAKEGPQIRANLGFRILDQVRTGILAETELLEGAGNIGALILGGFEAA